MTSKMAIKLSREQTTPEYSTRTIVALMDHGKRVALKVSEL